MTDEYYIWDRDTWKYILKYGLVLPQEFVEHVLSEDGLKFINRPDEEESSWQDWITNLKQREGMLCFMPDNAGNIDLEDF